MKQFLVNAPARAGLALVAWLCAAPMAVGQELQLAQAAAPQGSPASVELAAEIQRQAACAPNRSLADIRWLIRRAEPGDVALAMAALDASPTTCAGVRSAAARIAQEFPMPAPVEPPPAAEIAEAPAPPSVPVAADPDEERRAAAEAMKFTVGKPPRRLTRGLATGG